MASQGEGTVAPRDRTSVGLGTGTVTRPSVVHGLGPRTSTRDMAGTSVEPELLPEAWAGVSVGLGTRARVGPT